MITAGNIRHELADRAQGLACGGIGAMLMVARKTGLIATLTAACTCSSGTCRNTSPATC